MLSEEEMLQRVAELHRAIYELVFPRVQDVEDPLQKHSIPMLALQHAMGDATYRFVTAASGGPASQEALVSLFRAAPWHETAEHAVLRATLPEWQEP